MAWSAHDATNAILSACEVPADAYPNSFEKWGMANCKRKAIYKMWKDHVQLTQKSRPLFVKTKA